MMVEELANMLGFTLVPIEPSPPAAVGLDDHAAGALAGLVVQIGGVDKPRGVDVAKTGTKVSPDVRSTRIARKHTLFLPAMRAGVSVRSRVNQSNGCRGWAQCSRTVWPGRTCPSLSMSASVTTPITG